MSKPFISGVCQVQSGFREVAIVDGAWECPDCDTPQAADVIFDKVCCWCCSKLFLVERKEVYR